MPTNSQTNYPHTSVTDDELDAETVKLFRQQLRTVLIATIAVCIFTFLVFWNVSPHSHVLLWTGAVISLNIFRLLHARRLPEHQQLVGNTRYWRTSFTLFSGISGLIWGSSVLLLPASGEIYIVYITLILLSMVAASITSLTLILPAYYAFSISAIVPLTIKFISLGGNVYLMLALTSMAYLIAVLIFSRNIHKSYIESLRLRYENVELINRLSIEKARAEQANMEKSRFLAAASHDLRQPLHAMGLFLGSMKPYLVNDESRDLLDKSNRSLHALHGLFDALLDISRLDAGVIEVNRYDFSLREVLNNLETEFFPQAKNKDMKLSFCQDDFIIFTDPILITRCLRNLLSNAIQHSQSGNVSITCEKEGQQLRIKVTDTGPGIPEKYIDIIFKEFEQLNNPERDRRKGLGLGLAIVKRLSKLLECEINVESTLGEGSCFCIDVPLGNQAKALQLADNTSEITPVDQQQASILVIDDEIEILDAIHSLLAQWGHQVRTCTSVPEAVSIVNEGFTPELIISDYRLRDHQTGIEAIRQIKQQLRTSVPAVLMTGDTSPDRIQEAHDSGYPLIHKPVRPAIIRATVNQLLKYRA